jgi:probable HAF family extracellular repeat protein
MSRILVLGVVSSWLSLLACSRAGPSNPSAVDPADAATSGAAIDIDPYRELFIVDPSVVLDARGSSVANGPWSFRWLIEQMADAGTSPAALVEAWLRSLRTQSLNGFSLEDRQGVEEFLGGGSRAWPRTSSGALDLSRAPFRLLAIVNRLDLSEQGQGEGRFVFGLIDPATGAPERMTVAFEYRLPPLGTGDDLAEWGRRWHDLARHPFGEDYNAALEALTRAFTSRGVDPSGVGGSALAHVRTNEATFGEIWQLRQWQLDRGAGGLLLRLSELPQTPDQSLNGSEALASFLAEHADEVRAGRHDIPLAMRGGASPEVGAWAFREHPAIDESLRHAFARRTCNGCHSSETFPASGTLNDGSYRSFVFEAGALRDLGTLGGNETLAFAINSRGQVTGQSQTRDGSLQPFVFDGAALRGGGSLGGRFSRGHAINDKGQIAGLSELVPGDSKIHAFFWDGSALRDLGALPGLPWTSATGLNNAGEIVGNVYDKPDYKGDEYVTFAFVYRDGQMWNLNALIPPSSFTLLVALGINDRGQILCTDGQSGAPRSHGFLLTPVGARE